MGRDSTHIVGFTADELKAKQARGETRSDWQKAGQQPLPDGSDPDDAMEPIDWATAELPVRCPKTHASLRLDADMLDWFKARGRGYQTTINAVLRHYYQQQAGDRR